MLVKEIFWGVFLEKNVFKNVNINLWQSERPVKVVVKFWKAKELLVKIRQCCQEYLDL